MDDPSLLTVAVAAGLGVALVPRVVTVTGLPTVTDLPLADTGAVVALSAVAVESGATPQAARFLEL